MTRAAMTAKHEATARRDISARVRAARAVAAVLGGQSLTCALPAALRKLPQQERALTQELCYGCMRWQPQLQAVFDQLVPKPLRARDRDIQALVLVGLYQLLHTRIPTYAAVSECVSAASHLGGRPWAGRFVNGVLRSFVRQQDTLLNAAASIPTARWAHPTWILERLQQDWPEHWQSIATANNQHPPMALRVALDRTSRRQYLGRLAAAQIEGSEHAASSSAIALKQSVDVERLPGFERGLVSVQDPAAQLAAGLLEVKAQSRVLDACAAPGGKTGHILEQQPGPGELLALDLDTRRLARVTETLQRLRRSASLLAADAGAIDAWWDGRPFDRILLDAPCSASGVIRRHPDIKVLRRASDIPALAARQRRLLTQLWRTLAPGGKLLYATCSVFRSENEEIIAAFLEHHTDATETPIALEAGTATRHGLQILPGAQDMDGFYYALLCKAP